MDALCQRWHQTPSAILAEPADLIYGMLQVIGEGQEGAPQHLSEDDEMRLLLAERSEVLG